MAFKNRIKELRHVPASVLQAHPGNWRTHPELQKSALTEVLENVGWADAITAREAEDGTLHIIDGHLRAELDPDEVVPVLVLDLTEAEGDQLLAVFDPITMMAGADGDLLAALVAKLGDHEEQGLIAALAYQPDILATLGYTEPETEAGKPPKGDPHHVPANVAAKCQPGDLWRLGDHYLLNGSCTEPADVARLFAAAPGFTPRACVTDPPYNVDLGYDAATDDAKSAEAYAEFTRAWVKLALERVDFLVATPGLANLGTWYRTLDLYHVAPWTKTNACTRGYASLFFCWEPIVFIEGKTKPPRVRGNDVFNHPIGMQKEVGDHPCPKILSLYLDLVESYTEPGEGVYEPFCGSGTTLIACGETGRRCLAMEHSPHYVDIILQRWENVTGEKAVRVL